MATWRAVVTLNHAALGGTGTNTWHLRTAISDVGQANVIMGLVEDFYTGINGYFPDSASINWDGELVGVGANEGDFLEVADWTVVGGTAGGVLPPSQSIVVGWRTETGGRSGKGRTFLGPMHNNTLEANGTPDPTCLGNIRDAAADLVSASLADGNGALGVWSRQDSLLRDFTSSAVRDSFGSLRSRRD